jgi:predicted glycosyltransferase
MLRIWIDLANSPHPLLFAPLAQRLEARGHEVMVTARDNAQTVDLAREYWPEATVVGAESPASPVAKTTTLARRVRNLARWARQRHPDVALSHNSYAQIVAARLLGVPVVTASDFEHQPANHLAFRMATYILMPEALRGADVGRQGASRRKTVFYPGLKEEVYIGNFEPDREILSKIGIERSREDVIVVTRTPPTRAIYHRFPNPLFVQILEALENERNARVVVLTRHQEQREAISALNLQKSIVPTETVDARSLMYAADLVVGAGGTMTREAALLGVPTLSLFRGEQPAVDRWLEKRGNLRRVASPQEVVPIHRRPTEPRSVDKLARRSDELIDVFLKVVEATANGAPA